MESYLNPTCFSTALLSLVSTKPINVESADGNLFSLLRKILGFTAPDSHETNNHSILYGEVGGEIVCAPVLYK